MINSQFDSELLNNKLTAVYFWSPDCQKCKLLGPSVEASTKAKGISLIKINVSVERSIPSKYDVLGLPTLIFFAGARESLRLTPSGISIREIEESCEKVLSDL